MKTLFALLVIQVFIIVVVLAVAEKTTQKSTSNISNRKVTEKSTQKGTQFWESNAHNYTRNASRLWLRTTPSGSQKPTTRITAKQQPSFEDWKVKQARNYSSTGGKTEDNARKVYHANLRKIHEHNNKTKATYKQGVNSRADMTDDERSAKCKGYKPDPKYFKRNFKNSVKFKSAQFRSNQKSNLPKQLDLRSQMGPVKDQGSCGKFTTKLRQSLMTN